MLAIVTAVVVLVGSVTARDSLAPARTTLDANRSWTAIAAFDEVSLDAEVDGASPANSPARVRVRWTFHSAAVGPTSWARGVRSTVDVVEVDCPSGSSRTLSARAYDMRGQLLPAASTVSTDAPWTRHADGTMGDVLVRGVCDALARRGAR